GLDRGSVSAGRADPLAPGPVVRQARPRRARVRGALRARARVPRPLRSRVHLGAVVCDLRRGARFGASAARRSAPPRADQRHANPGEPVRAPGVDRSARLHVLIQKVVMVGTESTGKTTLARELARVYDTRWTHEFGREFWVEH